MIAARWAVLGAATLAVTDARAEDGGAAGGAGERFQLGINEAVAVPAAHRRRGVDLDAELRADAALAREVGATTVRGHTGNLPAVSMLAMRRNPEAALAETDAWVRAVQGAGLEPLMMVSPWPGNQTANHTEAYVPGDLHAYATYVRDLVERYDGDGHADMPGLVAPVHAWEVDNEPDLKNTNRPRGAERAMDPATFCTPEQYARVLTVSAQAIRAANPAARVLNGGFFRPHAETGEAYMRAVLTHPGVRDSIDVVSLHTYAEDDGELLARAVRSARALLPDRPVWVTETSSPSRPDEATQARRLAAFVARAAAAGASRLYWHTLADPPEDAARRGAAGGFATNSLFRTPPTGARAPKPAGDVYRNLAARLAGDDLIGAVSDGDGAVRLRSGAVLLYAGSRVATSGGIDLRTGGSVDPGRAATAPAWLFPGS